MPGSASRLAPLRAALRVARRDAWRNRGRSALVALMVALPVVAAGSASVIYHSEQLEPRDIAQIELGDQSQAAITYHGMAMTQDPLGQSKRGAEGPALKPLQGEAQVRARLQSLISSRNNLVVDSSLDAFGAIRHVGQRLSPTIREIDYTATGLKGLVEQESGRPPTVAGEVVISTALADRHGIRIGDTLSYSPPRQPKPVRTAPAKSLTVVGVVSVHAAGAIPSLIGPPGTLIPPADPGQDDANTDSTTWRVTGPDPVTWQQVRALNRAGATAISRAVALDPPPVDQRNDSGSGLSESDLGIWIVIVGLVLLQIGLLAGPAIAVGARRNQRGLAIMASTGAERRHLRAVVLATNGLIGVVAGLVGAVLGAGLGAVVVRWMMRSEGNQMVRVDVHWLGLLVLAAVGAVTAVLAALIPARQAARLDVVAVLTGRRGQLRSRLGVPLFGLVITAFGLVLAYLASARAAAFSSVAALALTEVGLIIATGAVLALAARLAGWMPFTIRFALRDAARQRARTVPATAAVLAAIAGATCSLVYLASQAGYDERSYSPLARYGLTHIQLNEPLDAAGQAEVETALRKTLPVTDVKGYRTQVEADTDGGDSQSWEVLPRAGSTCAAERAKFDWAVRAQSNCHTAAFSVPAEVFDDGSGYALLTGQNDPTAVNALRAGRVVVSDPQLLWADGNVHLALGESDGTEAQPEQDTLILPATVSAAPTGSQPSVLPLSAAKALGVSVKVESLLVATSRMPTPAEEQQAVIALGDVADGSLTVERGYRNNFAIGLLALVIAAAVVGLGGTFTAVGLAATESRADVATLAAVGAGPGMRRRLAASQAGVIAGLGSGLGLLSGVMAGWVLVRIQPYGTAYTSYGGIGGFGGPGGMQQWRLELPWLHLLAVGVGIPLLAVVVGYLTTRSRLPMIRRIGQ